MQPHRYRTLPLILVLSLFCITPLLAAGNGQSKRNINDNDTVVIHGNVPPQAEARDDRGPTDRTLLYEKTILLLQPRSNARDSIGQAVAHLNDATLPSYHQWLTPEQFGKRFGIADADLNDILVWLQGHGFTIDEIAPSRGWINITGNVAQVEQTFHTSIHDFEVDGKQFHANIKDPEIPRALADIVSGVVTLHNFPKKAMNHGFKPVTEYTSGTSHYVSPADFATIYNVNPLYSAGINGTGKTIAIVGRTDIALADVQYFRSFFGLVANDPVFVHNGTDPGDLGGGEEGEADLDVEWSGAVAPNATVKFVISKSTTSTDGVDLSAQYIVNNNVGDVMSLSFGQCESSMGTTENAFYNNLWSQAATQGITAFVSSGDSGAAGCNGGSDTTGSGAAVSGIASTPFNVAVGGTQFNDTASPSTWWNATNAANQSSAKSYIPEMAWNESGNVTGGSGLWASSGGASTVYTKPSWQVCVGVPANNVRYVPDVALTAAGHDGYLVIQGHTSTVSGLGAVGGTSASSPSFAGLMALVVQKTGQRWGNANTKFYSLANAQYASGGTVMFHDVTSGNNSVPGVTGFSCGTGYDAVTGVGTVDANALVNNFNGSTSDFSISASPASMTVVQGASGTSTLSTSISGSFNSAISLSASGAPSGTTVSFSPASIAAPGNGSSTMTIVVGATTAVGNYTITVTGTGGSTSHPTSVALAVTSGGSSALVNGTFESGNLTGWTGSGVAAVNTAAKHSGTYGAQLGSTSPSTDSSVAQTFTLPSNASTLSFWYANTCPDTLTYDWATATLKDNVSGTTTTILAKVCTATPNWTQVNTNVASNAGHSVTLTVSNHDDNYAGDPTFTYVDDVVVNTTAPDTTPPTTSITAPANGATVSGTVSVTATASDNVGVTKMEIYIDGVLSNSNTNATSLTFSWNTTAVANGSHTIQSKAYDAAGNVGSSTTITVTVSNSAPDTTPPTTSITAPANGATVSGTINVTATASDNVGVTKMEIYIDGALKTSNTNATSLTYSWNTTTAANGAHTITSKAYDAANNVGTSSTVSVTVSNTVAQQLIGNPGFENGSTNTAPWTTTAGVVDSSTGEPAHSGTWKAWLCGYGTTHTDTIVQTVTIASTVTTATLTFWLHIDTAETTTTTAFDTLNVQVRNSSGAVLATLATYSNLSKNTGYAQKSFDLSAYKGQTIQIYLVGSEDSSAQTSFVVDDFALNVQ